MKHNSLFNTVFSFLILAFTVSLISCGSGSGSNSAVELDPDLDFVPNEEVNQAMYGYWKEPEMVESTNDCDRMEELLGHSVIEDSKLNINKSSCLDLGREFLGNGYLYDQNGCTIGGNTYAKGFESASRPSDDFMPGIFPSYYDGCYIISTVVYSLIYDESSDSITMTTRYTHEAINCSGVVYQWGDLDIPLKSCSGSAVSTFHREENTIERDPSDYDGDGVANFYDDNCFKAYNPDQTDIDADNIGDACDDEIIVPVNDMDGDDFEDSEDNCPYNPNYDQMDNDADGIGNVCDNINNYDTDSDGFLNDLDNCPNTSNPLQTDTDHDGIGDACDSFDDRSLVDTDGDTIMDDIDNCIDIKNKKQIDDDIDGIGNKCDPDKDGDGILDENA